MLMNDLHVDAIPGALQADALRLWEHSPLFRQLMQTVPKDEYPHIFQPQDSATLPAINASWFPTIEAQTLDMCMQHLRQLKQRAMRHLIWWELGIHGDIEASYHAISDTASALLQQAVDMAEHLLAPRFGKLGKLSFCVIGLGKLGGRELNLGSDVDLLFIWQGEDHTQGGRASIPANEYYLHFSRMLIRLMAERTEHGLVWPVDMRLRPGGDGAPICLNLDATLSHYLEYGQTWERAMLIKARPIAGDLALGQAFVAGIAPFVYRRYLDYTSVAALADMKRRIDAQAGAKAIESGFDVKKGKGGIREIEFIIQSLQLIHGGREPSLCVYEGKKALDALTQLGLMDKSEAQRLFEAYLFWRRIEHAIQARHGEQTQVLPADYENYLSAMLETTQISAQMQAYQDFVATSFAEWVLPIHTEHACSQASWLHGDCAAQLSELSPHDKARVQQALAQIDRQLLRGILPERSRTQIETILQVAMPIWLKHEKGVQAIEAFAELLHAISGRATWIDLLATHRGTLNWLIDVLSASKYLASHIVNNPAWLEWPLENEGRSLEIQQICTKLAHLDHHEDEEAFLRTLGKLVDQARIQCALCIHANHEDPLTIGAWLADIADAATQACLRLSLHQLKLPEDFGFVALAMGKHGSREMGLVSDLDMVFILTEDPCNMIHGRSAREWAQRLGRRMIRQITSPPPFGAGYAFDARLRPSGNSGVLVTTLDGFLDYQCHHAQTWEHQALCRARAITGTQAMRKQVMAIVQSVIHQPRDPKALAEDIWQMRQKMLKHLASKDANVLNLKQDKGGLVDIEFLAQFARLCFGGDHVGTVSTLTHIPDHAPQSWYQAGKRLAEVYLQYRTLENILRVELWQSISHIPTDEAHDIWHCLKKRAPLPSPQALQQTMHQVHRTFLDLLDVSPLA